jgi:NTP pyrophosphatase (non-canonical NTP hydrolase)
MEPTPFEILVHKHSLLKGDLLYNSNALAGEVGECANIVKKMQMAVIKPEWTQQTEAERLKTPEYFLPKLQDELGDVLFYLTRMINDTGLSLEDIMQLQQEKLENQSIQYKRTFLK